MSNNINYQQSAEWQLQNLNCSGITAMSWDHLYQIPPHNYTLTPLQTQDTPQYLRQDPKISMSHSCSRNYSNNHFPFVGSLSASLSSNSMTNSRSSSNQVNNPRYYYSSNDPYRINMNLNLNVQSHPTWSNNNPLPLINIDTNVVNTNINENVNVNTNANKITPSTARTTTTTTTVPTARTATPTQLRVHHEIQNGEMRSFPMNNPECDRYISLKKVGSGTFADIYEVYDKIDESHYAIKVLRKSKRCKKYQTALYAEAHRLMKIKNHNHILAIHDLINDNVIGPCLVLELMGMSLRQYSRYVLRDWNFNGNQNSLMDTCASITLQMLSGIQCLHEMCGYIHADLKPENVMLTLGTNNQNNHNRNNHHLPHIKIVDFGNALSFNRSVNTFEVQSLYYRAPEVLHGIQISSAIDLWSIGAMLMEMIQVGNGGSRKALFSCTDLGSLSMKMINTCGLFPVYVYNKHNTFRPLTNVHTHSVAGYGELKQARKRCLLTKYHKNLNYKDFVITNHLDACFDLIACLLDQNPFTRYTAKQAIKHPFFIHKNNICDRVKIERLDCVIAMDDIERQKMILKQIDVFVYQNEKCSVVCNCHGRNNGIVSTPILKYAWSVISNDANNNNSSITTNSSNSNNNNNMNRKSNVNVNVNANVFAKNMRRKREREYENNNNNNINYNNVTNNNNNNNEMVYPNATKKIRYIC